MEAFSQPTLPDHTARDAPWQSAVHVRERPAVCARRCVARIFPNTTKPRRQRLNPARPKHLRRCAARARQPTDGGTDVQRNDETNERRLRGRTLQLDEAAWIT